MTFQRAIKTVYDGAADPDTADDDVVSRCITGSSSAFSLAASILLDYANRFPPGVLVDEVIDETRIGIDVPLLQQAVKARITAIATALFNQTECGEVEPMAFVGDIRMSAALSDPTAGWLECDGQSLLRTDYPALFAALGTQHGAVDSTHFTIPDYRSRSPMGQGALNGTTPANPVYSLGNKIGELNHTLTTPEIPSHQHNTTEAGTYTVVAGGTNSYGILNGATAQAIKTGLTGGGGAHNTLHPVYICRFFIYAGV